MGRRVYTELLTKIAANDAAGTTTNAEAVGKITPTEEADFKAAVEKRYKDHVLN